MVKVSEVKEFLELLCKHTDFGKWDITKLEFSPNGFLIGLSKRTEDIIAELIKNEKNKN